MNISLVIYTIITTCFIIIALSVMQKFFENDSSKTINEKKSIVETGSMTMFFLIQYLVIRFHFGEIVTSFTLFRLFLIIFGLYIVIFGTYVNVIGRYQLGKYWANQIKIYKNHKLLTTGMYQYVRHPLYASLIWICFGVSIVYQNWVALSLSLCIFTPFMYYRAKQEEELLMNTFSNYKDYQKTVYMFIPYIL